MEGIREGKREGEGGRRKKRERQISLECRIK